MTRSIWPPFFKTVADIDDIDAYGNCIDDEDIHPVIIRAWSFVAVAAVAIHGVYVHQKEIGLVGAWIERGFVSLPTRKYENSLDSPAPTIG